MRILLRQILAVAAIPMITGCATAGHSAWLGAGAGAGMGAGLGAMVDPGPKGEGRIRNVIIGAAAGSLLGAGTGYLLHEEMKDREQQSYDEGKKDAELSAVAQPQTPGAPVLLPPRIESRFVDEQVRGNVFVPAHFEYVIVEPARWSK